MGIATRHGAAGEALAASYLELRGWRVAARNQRIAGVEVDLLADDGTARVLVEVKLRSRGDYGGAALAIGPGQARRLRQAARAVAAARGGAVRIDLIALELDGGHPGMTLKHYRNAIEDQD